MRVAAKVVLKWNFITLNAYGEFPGGPVVKTPCFHCRGHGFDHWLGGKNNPTCHMAKKNPKTLNAYVKKKKVLEQII